MAVGARRREAASATPAVKVRWKPSAIRDVQAHVEYLDQFNPLAASDLTITLFTVGDSLATMPNRGRPGRISGTRELLAVAPYVIVYEVGQNEVMILHVWHGKLLA